MAVGDDNIKIGVSPDLSGFNKELELKLRSLSGFEIKINGKPVLTGFKSELNKELAKVEKSQSAEVKITPTVNKTEVNKFKSELNRQLSAGGKSAIDLTVTKTETANLRKQIQKQVFDKPFTVKAEMTKTSIKALQKQLTIPLELKLPTQGEINLLRARIQQRFGAIQVQVNARSGPVGNIGSGISRGATQEVEKFSYAQRNLARDLTIVGRAASQNKASLFSFLGAISPGQVALTAFSTALIGGTRAFIKFGLESSKNIEQVKRSFKGFLGDAGKAEKLFIELQDFAAVTPFDLENLAKASRTLLGAGVAGKDLLGVLGDVAGAGAQLGVTGAAVERVTNALAKIKGQGKVTQRELRTIFTAFPGFSPIKAIADNIPRFEGDTKKALKGITAGTVTADMAIKALTKGMREMEGAASALYAQSLTLAGSQETLVDRFQQVARSQTDPALAQMASNYREAAEVFNKQSKEGVGTGISDLLKNGSALVPVFAEYLVPAIDAFAGGLASLMPSLLEFVDAFGPTLLEAFKAFVNLLPAFGSGLTLAVQVISPLAPLLTVFAKAIGSIPTPLLALVGAIKLFNTVSKAGTGAGLFAKINKDGEKTPTVLGKIRDGIKGTRTEVISAAGTIPKAFQKIQNAGTGMYDSVKRSYQEHTHDIQRYREGVVKTVGEVEKASKDITKIQTGIAKTSLAGSLLQRKDLDNLRTGLTEHNRLFKNSVDTSTSGLRNLATNFDAASTLSLSSMGKMKAGMTTLGDGIKGGAKSIGMSLSSMVGSLASSIKSFGIEALITAAIVGVTYLVQKAAEARKIAEEIRKDAQLAAERLRYDTTAGTDKGDGSIEEANVFDAAIKSTQGKKAYESLLLGKEKSQFSDKTAEAFLKKNAEDFGGTVQRDTLVAQGNQQTKFAKTFEENMKRIDNAQALVKGGNRDLIYQTITDTKKYNQAIKDLNLAGRVARDARFNDFGAVNAENAAGKLKKLRTQYIDTFSGILEQNEKAAKDNKNKGLEKLFRDTRKEFEKTGDIAGAYDKVSKAIAKNAIESKTLEEKLRGVYNGSIKGADAQKVLAQAYGENSEAITEVQQHQLELNDTLSKMGDLSFDAAFSQLKNGLGEIYQLVDSVEDPTAKGKLVDQIASQMGLDEKGAKDLATKLANFRTTLIEGIQATVKEIGAALPALEDAFKTDFKFEIGGINAATLKANLKAYTDGIKSFGDNINKLKQDFPDLAEKIASLGPAAGGQLAKDLAKNPKLAQQIRDSLASAETAYGGYTNDILGIVTSNVEKVNGFDPGELSLPSLGIVPPDQASIDAAATQLADIQAKIEARRKEITQQRKTNKNLKSHGERGLGVSANPEDDPFFEGLLGEQKRLEEFLAKAREKVFTELETQAAASGGAINKSIVAADIPGAIRVQVAEAKPEIAKIATGADSLGAQIATNFAPSLKGAKTAGKSVVFKGNSAFDINAIIGDVLRESAKSTGTAAGEAMAKAFKDSFKAGAAITEAEAKLLSAGILKPFRVARTGINSLITALTAMGTSLGVPITIAQIPEFHTGGVVGSRGAKMHSGSIKDKEQLAVLLKGEAVLPHKAVNQMSPEMIKSLVKGDVDGFVPQYLKSKAYGGSNDKPSAEATASFESAPWVAQFDGIRRSIDAQMAQTKRQLVTLAFETFDEAHDMSVKYAKSFDSGPGQFGSVASIAALTGTMKEIAAKMELVKGKDNNYKTLIAYMKATGVPFDVSSTVRPGSITNSGNKSYHGFGRAVDFTGKKYGNDTKELYDIFKAFGPVEGLLAELIYGGPQAKYNIKNGKRTGKYAVADHHNHVHAALYNGALVQGSRDGIIANIGERGQSEVVLPMNNPARIMDLTTQAIRSQMLGVQGQQAMMMALMGSKSQPQSVQHGNNTNVGDIVIQVESPSADPQLQAEVIAMRVRSALRRL